MTEDPRIRIARGLLAFAWIFYTVFILSTMILTYALGVRPLLWGLPLWVCLGSIIAPAIFIVLLIVFIERLVPDISMSSDPEETSES